MPKRIQLSRKRGWRKPEGAVVVSRPSKFGNPFRVIPKNATAVFAQAMRVTGFGCDSHAEAVDKFREMLMRSPNLCSRIVTELAGKDLCCFCPLDRPCHADALLELSNGNGSLP